MSGSRSRGGGGGGGGEPDWSKFGLDKERGGGGGGRAGESQPLTGASAAGNGDNNGASADRGGGEMYGGQIQHDSELFADDQVKKDFDSRNGRGVKKIS